MMCCNQKKPQTIFFGIHNNLPEGPAYPVRTISDGTFRYIRNLKVKSYILRNISWVGMVRYLNNPYWATWVRSSWVNENQLVRIWERLMKNYIILMQTLMN